MAAVMTIRLDSELLAWLDTRAREAGMSRNQLVAGFLAEAKRRDWTARENPPTVVE